ncbi:MAG: ribbon-helix-helix protein, CopG family [Sulfolobus sp.]
MRNVAIRVDVETLKKLEEYVKMHGITKSAAVRKAIREANEVSVYEGLLGEYPYIIIVKIDDKTLDKLDDLCRRYNMKRGEVIRAALRKMLRNNGFEVDIKPKGKRSPIITMIIKSLDDLEDAIKRGDYDRVSRDMNEIRELLKYC